MSALEWLRSRAGKRTAVGNSITLTIDNSAEGSYRWEPQSELEATGVALMPPNTLRMMGGRVVSCVCHVVYSECRCGRSGATIRT